MVIRESLTFGLQNFDMVFFRKYAILFVVMAVISGCGRKKHSLSGDEPVEVEDFVEFFALRNLQVVGVALAGGGTGSAFSWPLRHDC